MLDYAEQHPRPDQIHLLVEAADSTLKQGCEVKDQLYAQAGIADDWVLDLKNHQLHIFRDPTPEGYTQHLILKTPNQAIPLNYSGIQLSLASLLPQQSSW